jgi:hypothetical protein
MRTKTQRWLDLLLTLLAGLLLIWATGCQRLPQEVEWHENGQMKAIRYYKRGGMNIKVFCYDTDNHNQTMERSKGE